MRFTFALLGLPAALLRMRRTLRKDEGDVSSIDHNDEEKKDQKRRMKSQSKDLYDDAYGMTQEEKDKKDAIKRGGNGWRRMRRAHKRH